MAEKTKELKDLNFKRGLVKGTLTRFSSYIKRVSGSTIQNNQELESRFADFKTVLTQFNEIQDQIQYLDEENQLKHETDREKFEDEFYAITAEVKNLLTPSNKENIANQQSNPANNNSTYAQNQTVQLPSINLPTFNGQYDQWLAFKEMFISLIDSNASLSSIQKFQYLRASLRDDASEMIHSLELSSDNYTIAWNLLQERYQNTNLIVFKHVKSMVELPSVPFADHVALRQLLNSVVKHIRALSALNIPTEHWDILLIYLLSTKLDTGTRHDWEAQTACKESLPTMDQMTSFLRRKCQILETVCPAGASANPEPAKKNNQPMVKKQIASHVSTTPSTCYLCKGHHMLYACEKFLGLTIDERFQEVKRLRLCINCLGSSHRTANCRSRRCNICKKSHNSLLHKNSGEATTDTRSNTSAPSETVQTTATHHAHAKEQTADILLSTAVVEAFKYNGGQQLLRVLLDSGSQSNFITQAACESLGLIPREVKISIVGVSKSRTSVTRAVELTIKSRFNGYRATLTFLVLEKITEDLPLANVSTQNLKIPSNIKLADPAFYNSSTVDILLGAEIFFDVLCVGQLKLNDGTATLQKTQFGWIVAGKVVQEPISHLNSSACHLTVNDLDERLKQFWELEEVGGLSLYSQEENQCVTHYELTHTRLEDGRYEVKLPFKENLDQLGDSKQIAMKRFEYLERKLAQNPELKTQYNKFMQEYIELDHMSLARTPGSQANYFLPHHAVIKNASLTTKLRVVFDGSAKTTSGTSLNDTMMKGPTIQEELLSIILRFREHNYVMTADIEKMYRQVRVNENDRKYQQILWRFEANDPIQTYTLNTVTYGTTSAPFLAVKCLHQLADDEHERFPTASAVLRRDFYVDDVITGSKTIMEATQLQSELNELLAKGGFTLRKWRSNEPSIIQSVPDAIIDSTTLPLEKHDTIRTLGVSWKPSSDTLGFSVPELQENKSVTKRTILAKIAQIFDPLGLLGPVTTQAKLIMQRLWELKINWDESVPISVRTQWNNFQKTLSELNQLQIPRQVIALKEYANIQLHGFSDASEVAYGACIYVRVTNQDKGTASRLLCSKSRVAPLKRVTLPRLELCAALLLANLMEYVAGALNSSFDSVHFWTDSTIVLSWLAAPPNTWQTFVANRVAKIQAVSNYSQWEHVNTKQNPADALSRGLLAEQLLNNDLWWTGPQWLSDGDGSWPNQNTIRPITIDTELERRRVVHTMVSTEEPNELFTRYSNVKRLQRVVAYVLRFRNNTLRRENRQFGSLTAQELQVALRKLILCAQRQSFEQDIKEIKKGNTVKGDSKLKTLNPFLDKQGILRVGGRITHANVPYEQRHPTVLAADHKLTKLLIWEEHIRLLHAGPLAVLASIRKRYWPISGRSTVRAVTRKCIPCFKAKPKAEDTFMGNLPKHRVNPARPFSNCGVDYCGPINIRLNKTRGRVKTSKCYIAVFVCFATKAVHIEAVTDLTTDAFLSALRRFTARRGICKHIYSDNGTNFVGANNQLKELKEFLTNTQSIAETMASDGVTWHFIPARSPHFGGLWEASVKSLKHHFHRVVGNTLLTLEELYTLVAQIEAVLNSRPLTPISNDPNDFTPLTPAHFLIGDSLVSPPEESLEEIPLNRLSRWQHVQLMQQHFWSRWSSEYLNQMQQRTKWTARSGRNPSIGDLVVLREDNLPPLRWKTGRICDLHPGTDGTVRVVSVKTLTGVVRVALKKVCMLPIASED